MEIEKGKTSTQVPTIEFADQTGSDIALWVEEHHKQGQSVRQLFVDVETDYFKFSQEDIQSLLPYLQSFAETGQLEPQQSTLHVGRDAFSILAMHRGRYSQQFAHEKERIQTCLMDGIINPDASQAADRLESKLEALRDLEDDLSQSTLRGGMISVDFVKSVIERYMNDHDAFDACEAILQDLALPETKHAQSPTLQGGDERVEAIANASAKHVLDILEAQNNGLAIMQEAGVAMAQNIVEQGKRIQALEQLMMEWKSLAVTRNILPADDFRELQERTSQLLGE